MASLVWDAGGLGNDASEGANWDTNNAPIAGDDINFNGGTGKQCNWDIAAKMGIVTSPPPSDDTVVQGSKLTCVDFIWEGIGAWTRNLFDIEFDKDFKCDGPMVYASFNEKDICNSAEVLSIYSQSNPYGDLNVAKVSGTFRQDSIANFKDILLEGVNGSFTFLFPAGQSLSGDTFSSQGTLANLITVTKNGFGPAPIITVNIVGVDSAFTNFQDLTFDGLGSPIIATDNCIDAGGNTGITFGIAPPTPPVNDFVCVTVGDLLIKFIAALRENAYLVETLLGGDDQKISTHLPQSLNENTPVESKLPYIFISLGNSDWSTKCKLGYETLFTLNIWSQKRDPSEAVNITDTVIAILEQNELTLAVGKNVLLHFQDQNLFMDNDTKTYRSVLIMRALSA